MKRLIVFLLLFVVFSSSFAQWEIAVRKIRVADSSRVTVRYDVLKSKKVVFSKLFYQFDLRSASWSDALAGMAARVRRFRQYDSLAVALKKKYKDMTISNQAATTQAKVIDVKCGRDKITFCVFQS